MTPSEHIAPNSALAEWMKANKVTDADLATRIGKSRPFVTRIRAGDRQPSLPVAPKLAEITKLPVAAFMREAAA